MSISQGLPLGLFLFLVYIKDLLSFMEGIEHKIVLFANVSSKYIVVQFNEYDDLNCNLYTYDIKICLILTLNRISAKSCRNLEIQEFLRNLSSCLTIHMFK